MKNYLKDNKIIISIVFLIVIIIIGWGVKKKSNAENIIILKSEKYKIEKEFEKLEHTKNFKEKFELIAFDLKQYLEADNLKKSKVKFKELKEVYEECKKNNDELTTISEKMNSLQKELSSDPFISYNEREKIIELLDLAFDNYYNEDTNALNEQFIELNNIVEECNVYYKTRILESFELLGEELVTDKGLEEIKELDYALYNKINSFKVKIKNYKTELQTVVPSNDKILFSMVDYNNQMNEINESIIKNFDELIHKIEEVVERKEIPYYGEYEEDDNEIIFGDDNNIENNDVGYEDNNTSLDEDTTNSSIVVNNTNSEVDLSKIIYIIDDDNNEVTLQEFAVKNSIPCYATPVSKFEVLSSNEIVVQWEEQTNYGNNKTFIEERKYNLSELKVSDSSQGTNLKFSFKIDTSLTYSDGTVETYDEKGVWSGYLKDNYITYNYNKYLIKN